MRHPDGLRAAAGTEGIVIALPAIGATFQGGFFAGTISRLANNIATHALIVAPRATGASGPGYPITTSLQWKTSNTTTANTTSSFDGAANTAAMVTAGIAAHPAANFCVGLSIGGYSDWYFPARYELDIAYQNLKPTTTSNSTGWGINPYSVPERTVNRTAGAPAQTSVAAFQSGGAEAFPESGILNTHWTSSESTSSRAWDLTFIDGAQSGTYTKTQTFNKHVRAFRKIAL